MEIEDDPVVDATSSPRDIRPTRVKEAKSKPRTPQKPSVECGNESPNIQLTPLTEKKSSKTSPVNVSPKVTQDTTIIKKEKLDDDVMATDAGQTPVDEAEEIAQKVVHQISDGPLPMSQYESCAQEASLGAEGKPTAKPEEPYQGKSTSQRPNLVVDDPMEGVEASNGQMTMETASAVRFSSNCEELAEIEQSVNPDVTQNNRSESVIKHDSPPSDFDEKSKEDHDMELEHYGQNTMATNTSDYDKMGVTERPVVENESHTEITGDGVPMDREGPMDVNSAPFLEACVTNQGECSNLASASVHDTIATKHEAVPATAPSEVFKEEVDIEERASNGAASTRELEDASRNEDSLAPNQTVMDEFVRESEQLDKPVYPSQGASLAANPGNLDVLNCAQDMKDEKSSECQHLFPCARLDDSKTKADTDKLDHRQEICEKPVLQNDGTSNSGITDFPQLDGSFEEKKAAPTSDVKANCLLPSIENIQNMPASFVNIGKSTEFHNESIMLKGAELDVSTKPATNKVQASFPSQAPHVQIAHDEKIKTAPATMANSNGADVLRVYDNLFRIYYNLPPRIDTESINKALMQSELLVDAARLYGTISVVRPYINAALMNFGRQLYMAIMKDPPRWLHLAFFLESKPMFKEGVIHIVANHPFWPWPTLKMDEILSPIGELIENKLDIFLEMKESVNKALFSNEVRNVEVFSRTLNNDDFDTWFVVQYWRDWFARSLAKANKASDVTQMCMRCKVYRDIGRNGDAYLPTILVLDAVEACRSKDLHAKAKRQGIERDLRTLKDFAQKAVTPLCANYSMLSVEDAGIDYLTCIKVEDDELPWMKQSNGIQMMQSRCQEDI
ncbi:hypothetical protein ONS96_000208 [Cadophora gregata f. sp. sojae]|nr:hypothetical protein ONS96_000208 [Cadophora gregata f. sp. sojae]